MHDVQLLVEGLAYSGWKSLGIRRSLEDFARSFDVTFNDRWSERATPVPIRKGQSFQLLVDGVVLITGHIDDTSRGYDARQHTLQATGRSNTGDLVDCHAVVSKGKRRRWEAGATIQRIATDLCQPFSIAVGGPTVTDVLTAPLPKAFAVERGERVFEALSRLADLKGLLLQTSVHGDVVFTRAGTKKVATVLSYAHNILSCQQRSSDRDRFSHYVFRGQTTADDDTSGQASTQIRGFAVDDAITRYRPYEVSAMVQSDNRDLGFRALWERNTRAGRSETLTYTVRGWSHADGLWSPNTLVDVDDGRANVRDTLLISGVNLRATAQEGYLSELELVDRRTYDVVGAPKPKPKAVARRPQRPRDGRIDIPRRNPGVL